MDNNDKKVFYLQSVQSFIIPTSTVGLNLWSREPKNENSSTIVASTAGMTYGMTGTVAESSPSMGCSIAYTTAQAATTTITDWASATANGTDVSFLYDLNRYRSAHN